MTSRAKVREQERAMRSISRRRFLSSAARGAAAVGALAVPGVSAAIGANERVAVGVIGVRGMGGHHLGNLLRRDGVRVAALADVDRGVLGGAVKTSKDAGAEPSAFGDFRRLLDEKSIDAVIVATPHHWHAPIAYRAIEAGKDVYVEKPASHVFSEGRVLVEAAKKRGRIVQHGTQMRSSDVTRKAGELLASGVIGTVKMSKAWNIQRHSHRPPAPDAPAPEGVDYDFWLGPAPKRPFNPNRFHGNWQWFRDYGNGDIGNDGIHDIDMARWGLGVTTHPVRITAHGSRIDLEGEREYPDNMTVSYHYEEGKVLIYEDRGWTPYGLYGFDSGNAFYGTEGWMLFTRRGYFQVYLGRGEEKGPAMKGGAGHPEHLLGFIDSVRTREQPSASAEIAHLSCALVHLGEVGYRVGRVLLFDPATETVRGDPEANALLTKDYREPWGMPKAV
jgi:predicted dehydrogenase